MGTNSKRQNAPPFEELAERFASDVLHHQVRATSVDTAAQHCDDIGVLDRFQSGRFALEASDSTRLLEPSIREHLQRDVRSIGLGCEVDVAHPSSPKQPQDGVRLRDDFAGARWRGRCLAEKWLTL